LKLGKNASDMCAMLSKAYGGRLQNCQVFLRGINSWKRVARTWKMNSHPKSHRTDENVEEVQNLVPSDVLSIRAVALKLNLDK
jgi:hypothetical protein